MLALLCVPASAFGIAWGFLGGGLMAMILADILEPGSPYDHYSVGTTIGNIVILGPVAVGAVAPWIALGCYILRKDMKKAMWTVLLAWLCVPAAAVDIFLGFIVGCIIAMTLAGILEPGSAYDHYSIGTPIGNIAIIGPIEIGATVPWLAWGWYTLRTFRTAEQPKDKGALAPGPQREGKE